MKLQRYDKNPILGPKEDSVWEKLAVTNPGAWYNEADREVILLYRAAGDDADHKIHLGMAISHDGYHFERVSDQPVLSPTDTGFDAGCVEDPRIIKMGEYYYITYAARPYPPGQYWLNLKGSPNTPNNLPEDFPVALRQNLTSTGLALTKDFKTFIRAGRLTNPTLDDRDVILFPEKIAGRYWMLQRPMQWTGADFGTDHPAMWIASGKDLLAINNQKLLAKAEFNWEKKIGGNTPPIRTDDGWLVLYHAVGTDDLYRLGAMLLDLEDPSKVLCRTKDWLLQPEEWYELEGYYNGVVFPCGAVVIDGTLFVYYGGADKYIGLATCDLEELLSYLKACPENY